MAAPETAFSPSAVEEIVQGLTKSLADTSIETLKAQNFHWNVTGMAFGPLHALFQEMYEDHFVGQDELAERIKALGEHAVGAYSAYVKLSSLEESDGKLSAEKMVAELAEDQAAISSTLRALAAVADKHDDVVTNDLAIERAQKHDKFAWILKSHLE